MRKRHGIQYSEELHGYCESFQEVLMFGLKIEGDPDVTVSEVHHEDDGSQHDGADVKLHVLQQHVNIVEDGVVLQYEDVNLHTINEVVVASSYAHQRHHNG
jgi:hypothetical protein